MKTQYLIPFFCVAGMLFWSACQNTMFVGEQHGINLDVEAKNDPSEPAKFNFGFESHVAAIVPPTNPIPGNFLTKPLDSIFALSDSNNVPKGDLLSSVMKFRIVHSGTNALASVSGTTMSIQCFIATGAAANAMFSRSPAAARTTGTGMGAAISDLTKNPNNK